MIPNNLNLPNTKIKGKLVPTSTDIDSQSTGDGMCRCKPSGIDLVTMNHWPGHVTPNAREIGKLTRT